MWYLIACIAGVGSEMCIAPTQMPNLEVCQTVGGHMRKAMIAGARRVVCVNGETGQAINVKEP